VCVKAGSHFTSLAIFMDSDSQPAANMRLELLKKNVILYKNSWDKQLQWFRLAFAAVCAGVHLKA
jgi:hypothetical protein